MGSTPFLQIPMTICICLLFGRGVYSFPTNSYDDLHLPILWKRGSRLGSTPFLQIPMTICICLFCGGGVFQLGSTPFLQIPMTICICLFFGRQVFNWDLFFSYKFLWRSASPFSLEEEFSIRIYSFPTNSYDDLHLLSLYKRSFQSGSTPFLQIPMTICICRFFGRGVFN